MHHQVLIKEEDMGYRLYLDENPVIGKWFTPKDMVFAKIDAFELAKNNVPCDVIMAYGNGYREIIYKY